MQSAAPQLSAASASPLVSLTQQTAGLNAGPPTGGMQGGAPSNFPSRLYQHVLDLTSLDKREQALLELSKKREEFPDLAPILWHSYGTIAALVQEIVSIYPLLAPPRLTPSISNRCCNALALLQCVASHAETRAAFLNSHLGLFLYPFLNTVCTMRQYEYLRLTSLGVIGALVKMDDSEVISFLLQTEIIPLCFPEKDTRVLTDTGLLFLGEIEARQRRGEAVLYGCYEVGTSALVFRSGRLVFPSAPTRLINFTAPDEARRWRAKSGPYGDQDDCDEVNENEEGRITGHQLSLRVTPNHRMFVQLGNEDVRGNVTWSTTRTDGRQQSAVVKPPSMVEAHTLLSPCDCPADTTLLCVHRRRSVRMVAIAEAGVAPASDTAWRDSLIAALGLPNDLLQMVNARHSLPVFFEIYGFWLSNGSLHYQRDGSGQDSVCFNLKKPEDFMWLQANIPLLGLVFDRDWHRDGNEINITEPRWFRYFDRLDGFKYEHTGLNTINDAGQTERVKCFAPWVNCMGKEDLRHVLSGLRRANGSESADINEIYTSWDDFRDAIMAVGLRAGYSVAARLMCRAGTIRRYHGYNREGHWGLICASYAQETGQLSHPVRAIKDSWAVKYTECDSASAKDPTWPSMRRQEGAWEEPYTASVDGRIWCVEVDHPDHLIFAQRAERTGSVVTKQSRPIVVGNCLRIMDNGSELSKTVATFIIQKILLDEMGLNYICATYERFSTVSSVLSKMVTGLQERPSVRLLKHIVRCYLRLSDNTRARDALRGCLPLPIRDGTFSEVLKDDTVTKRWMAQLLFNIGETTQQNAAQSQQPSLSQAPSQPPAPNASQGGPH